MTATCRRVVASEGGEEEPRRGRGKGGMASAAAGARKRRKARARRAPSQAAGRGRRGRPSPTTASAGRRRGDRPAASASGEQPQPARASPRRARAARRATSRPATSARAAQTARASGPHRAEPPPARAGRRRHGRLRRRHAGLHEGRRQGLILRPAGTAAVAEVRPAMPRVAVSFPGPQARPHKPSSAHGVIVVGIVERAVRHAPIGHRHQLAMPRSGVGPLLAAGGDEFRRRFPHRPSASARRGSRWRR